MISDICADMRHTHICADMACLQKPFKGLQTCDKCAMMFLELKEK